MTLRDAQPRERAQRAGVLRAPCEQLLGFGHPALQDAQLGERGERRCAHRRHVALVDLERVLQGALGVGPATRRHEHAGVDRAAGAEQRRRAVLARELVDELAPLRRALPVAGRGRRHDQVAVRLGERVDVANAPRGRRRERLLEQLHPLLLAAGVDLGAPEQAEREDLEVAVVVLARDLHRA